jgi:thioesterase domain-containing protein
MKEQCKKLQELIHREVPLTKVMGMRVLACLDDSLTLQAPLEPNINIHGTAFGGSLFSLAALAGWGLLQLKLSGGGEPENMVLGHARIAYHLPVRGDITVRCKLPVGDKFQSFIDDFHQTRKARIKMVAEVVTEEGVAATFTGIYVAWKSKVKV